MIHYPIETTSLQSFKSSIKAIPILSDSEEKELVEQYTNNGCQYSAQKLILHHLRFVAYIVQSYSGYNMPEEDLIQEGTVGLMKAVKKFSLDFGVKLATFASNYIKAEIVEYIIGNIKSFKVATTKAQRKIFFNLGLLNKTQSNKEVAKELNVPEYEVQNMRLRTMASIPFIQDGEDDESDPHSPHLFIESNEPKQDDLIEYRDINKYLDILNDKELDIVKRRVMTDDPEPFKQIALDYNVSHQRIEQILKRSLQKMQQVGA